MGDRTAIEWTDATWNPIRGCSRVSEGCRHCYAEKVAARFSGPGQPYHGLAVHTRSGEARWTGKVQLVREHLADPMHWRRPRRIFVNSMSDLFHESIEFDTIAAIFGVMEWAATHTFQVLTKRPARMRDWVTWIMDAADGPSQRCYLELRDQVGLVNLPIPPDPRRWPLPNVWLGVSAEDQETADARIPLLLQTPAAVRFVSAEPLLGPLNLRGLALSSPRPAACACGHGHGFTRCPNTGGVARRCHHTACRCEGFTRMRGEGLHWVIVGGESGPGARPMDLVWARALVAQCRAASVPVFVKQLGATPYDSYLSRQIPAANGSFRLPEQEDEAAEALGLYLENMEWLRLRDRKGGDWTEWPEDLRVREFPTGREEAP